MRYFLSYLIILVFSFYFIITLFLNFPETSIVIGENYKTHRFLNRYLFQKWSFFAPPPESNKRVYFQYYYKNNRGKIDFYEIELFEKFGKNIQAEYLLNDITANTDWILFNFIDSITDQFRSNYDLYKNSRNCQNDECYEKFYKDYNNHLKTTKQFLFLKKQAKELGKKFNIPSNTMFRIKFCELKIPKYIDRYKVNLEIEENNIFNSEFVKL